MDKSRAEKMVATLLSNAAGVKYGSVSICVKLYAGEVVQVLFSTTENTKESIKDTDEEISKFT